jgi:hypothetical protein
MIGRANAAKWPSDAIMATPLARVEACPEGKVL